MDLWHQFSVFFFFFLDKVLGEILSSSKLSYSNIYQANILMGKMLTEALAGYIMGFGNLILKQTSSQKMSSCMIWWYTPSFTVEDSKGECKQI